MNSVGTNKKQKDLKKIGNKKNRMDSIKKNILYDDIKENKLEITLYLYFKY